MATIVTINHVIVLIDYNIICYIPPNTRPLNLLDEAGFQASINLMIQINTIFKSINYALGAQCFEALQMYYFYYTYFVLTKLYTYTYIHLIYMWPLLMEDLLEFCENDDL